MSTRGGPELLEVRRLWSPDRKRWVVIGSVGASFTFQEEADLLGATYDSWADVKSGGLYETADIAEREARAIIPWLANISN